MAKVTKWMIFVRVFLAAAIAGAPTRLAQADDVERAAWQAALTANTQSAIYDFLRQYPQGEFLDEAIGVLDTMGALDQTSQGRQMPKLESGSNRSSTAPSPY